MSPLGETPKFLPGSWRFAFFVVAIGLLAITAILMITTSFLAILDVDREIRPSALILAPVFQPLSTWR